jgi:hypothetical protein
MSLKDAASYRTFFQDKSTNLQILAATDDQASFIAPKSADHQIFVQSITVAITTYSAKTWSFEDSAGTAVPIWLLSIPAAAPTTGADATYRIDFGAKGVPLTVGKGLSLNVSAAGAAGMISVEAYQKLNGVVAVASTN